VTTVKCGAKPDQTWCGKQKQDVCMSYKLNRSKYSPTKEKSQIRKTRMELTTNLMRKEDEFQKIASNFGRWAASTLCLWARVLLRFERGESSSKLRFKRGESSRIERRTMPEIKLSKSLNVL